MTYSSEVLADSPVGYWKLDETSGTTLADASGNSHPLTLAGGTLNQTSVMPSGAASIKLNGSTSQYASAGYAAWMDLASFTVEAWLNPADNVSYHAIASRDAASPRGWQFFIESGKLSFYDSGGAGHAGSNTVSVGTVYHVAATYNNSSHVLKLYLNGALDSSFSSVTVGNASSLFDLYVGITKAGTPSLNFAYNGNIDEVAYYASELSAARIQAHYDAGYNVGPFTPTGYDTTILADTPAGYWPLDESSGTVIADRSGGSHHGTYNGATLNQAALLSGSAAAALGGASGQGVGSIASGAWMNQSGAFSVECWVKPTISDTNYRGFFSRFAASSGAWMLYQQNGKLAFDIVSTIDNFLPAPASYSTGQIYHLVGTHDGTTMRLYVNGVQVASQPLAAVANPASAIQIGGYNGTNYAQATIDNPAFYTSALSAARVAAHYVAGGGTIGGAQFAGWGIPI